MKKNIIISIVLAGIFLGVLYSMTHKSSLIFSSAPILQIFGGGTGTSTVPAYGKMLVGNGTGYDLVATSSLGISGGGSATPAGSTGYVQFNTANALNADAKLFWDNTNKWLGVGTSTPVATVDVNGGLYSEMASSTLFTYDFCTSSNNITFNATSTSALVKFTNANKCTGKSIIFNVVAPASGNIGSTTFSNGTNTGWLDWGGSLFMGTTVVNSLVDQFVFISSATGTPYIQSSYTNTF